MRKIRTSVLAGAGAFALAGSVIAPGIAAADDNNKIEFDAKDNGDCTATFTVENTTNFDFNFAKVNYWVGENVPENAPDFGKNSDSDGIAVQAEPAGEYQEAYTDLINEGKAPEQAYQDGLDPVTTTETVDFSEYADEAEDGKIKVGYRFTGVDDGDYDTDLKPVDVTCGDDNPLGSLDVFGSLGSITGDDTGSDAGSSDEENGDSGSAIGGGGNAGSAIGSGDNGSDAGSSDEGDNDD